MALELQHLAGPLIERINGHVGRPLVHRLRFVHQPPFTPAPSVVHTYARPERRSIADFPNGPLHDALAGLGAEIAALRNDDAA